MESPGCYHAVSNTLPLNLVHKILKSFNQMSMDQKAVIWTNGNNDLNRMTRQIKKISRICVDLYFQKCIRVLLF